MAGFGLPMALRGSRCHSEMAGIRLASLLHHGLVYRPWCEFHTFDKSDTSDTRYRGLIARTIAHHNTRVFIAACTLVCALAAQAQDLAQEVRRAAQLAPEQATAVANYVKDHSANLASNDPQQIRRDRAALLSPLADAQATPAFRIRYSEALAPIIRPLAENASEIVAINALVLAGDLATSGGAEILTKAADSSKPAIRYQAAYGLRRTFEALSTMPSPTMRADQIEDAVKLIGTRLSAENDALVIDGLVLASIEAMRITTVRRLAVNTLCTALGTKIKAQKSAIAGDSLAKAFLRAGTGVRDVLTGSQSGQLSPEAIKAAAELGGQMIAYCVKTVESKVLTADKASRDIHSQLATVGETLVLLATNLQGATPPASKNLGAKLRDASTQSDASFGIDARTLIGPGGLLSKDPFKFAGNAFLDK